MLIAHSIIGEYEDMKIHDEIFYGFSVDGPVVQSAGVSEELKEVISIDENVVQGPIQGMYVFNIFKHDNNLTWFYFTFS